MPKVLTLRVAVPSYSILGPQSPYIGGTLRPKCLFRYVALRVNPNLKNTLYKSHGLKPLSLGCSPYANSPWGTIFPIEDCWYKAEHPSLQPLNPKP